jgi:hypothetical protein
MTANLQQPVGAGARFRRCLAGKFGENELAWK